MDGNAILRGWSEGSDQKGEKGRAKACEQSNCFMCMLVCMSCKIVHLELAVTLWTLEECVVTASK